MVTIRGEGTAVITVTAAETEAYGEGRLKITIQVTGNEDPDDPDDPDNPDNPDNPDDPDNPDNPNNPSNPDNPDNPDKPSGNQGNNTPKPVKVTKIKIRSSLSNKIAAGKKVKLSADVSPSNAANKGIKWTSSNPKTATVSASGVVTMKKNSGGKTVTITAAAADGGAKAGYKITSMKGVVKKVSISGQRLNALQHVCC